MATTAYSYISQPKVYTEKFSLEMAITLWTSEGAIEMLWAMIINAFMVLAISMFLSNEKYQLLLSFYETSVVYKEQVDILNCLDVGIITQKEG